MSKTKRRKKNRKKRNPYRKEEDQSIIKYRNELSSHMNVTLSFLTAAVSVCRRCQSETFTALDIKYRMEAAMGRKTAADSETVAADMADSLSTRGFLDGGADGKFHLSKATIKGIQFSRFLDLMDTDDEVGIRFRNDPFEVSGGTECIALDLGMPRQESLAIMSIISYLNHASVGLDEEVSFDRYKEHVDEINGYISDVAVVESAFNFLMSNSVIERFSDGNYKFTPVFLTAMLVGPYLDGRKD